MEKVVARLRQKRIFQLFTIGLRYLIGSAFVFASIVKIEGQRFTAISGENYPINSAWHYFETMYRSGIYWNLIGWGQLIAGFLLMSQLYSTLGALAFFPIITNIFFVTISYPFAGTPVITFLMLLANTYLLLWDWNKLKVIILPNPLEFKNDEPLFMMKKAWLYLGLFYFALTIIMKKGSDLLVKNPDWNVNPFYFLITCFLVTVVSGVITLISQLRK